MTSPGLLRILQLICATFVALATAAFVVVAIAMVEPTATDQIAWPKTSYIVAAVTMSLLWLVGWRRRLFPGVFALAIIATIGTLLTYHFSPAQFGPAVTMTLVSVASCLVSFLFFRIVVRWPTAKVCPP